MALTGRPGRPRREADIDWTTDPAQFYYDRFYEACSSLCYSDCLALSHTLKISLRQVYNWRNRVCFPHDIGVALHVMDWVAAGKPTKLVTQRKIYDSMF